MFKAGARKVHETPSGEIIKEIKTNRTLVLTRIISGENFHKGDQHS